jgi:serine-type D-Ala-D-Ala carboxypeptidase (penicillin-binding protein 5/6)
MKAILLFAGLLFSFASNALQLPEPPVLASKSYLLYDFSSNQILVNQNGNARLEPASLTKLMTAYLTFSAIQQDKLKLDQSLTVPVDAPRNTSGESRMLLKPGQSVTVDELLRGLIVQSGNDAANTLAVHVAGSEAAFVEQMNKEAQRLGMKNTHFVNPVGMPDAQHYSTAYDMAILAAALIRDYPEHYPLFGLRDYTFNNVTQANRNRLLWLDPYADGLKTGHTETAGFCLVGSAKRIPTPSAPPKVRNCSITAFRALMPCACIRTASLSPGCAYGKARKAIWIWGFAKTSS